MNWTKKEFAEAMTYIEFIRYRYRYDKEIFESCDIIYKRIAEDKKNNVRLEDFHYEP